MIELIKRFLAWLRSLFTKKLPSKRQSIYGGAPDRGKEDKHTKKKRLMTMRSRRINRLYAERKRR